MTAYADPRTSRDFLASGAGILLVAILLVLIALWYVKPRPAIPLPPARCRVMYVRENAARTALAPIHFSLPSKIGFSRTVQPGDPRMTTTLGSRLADPVFLPRETGADNALPTLAKNEAPVFRPEQDEAPVFRPAPAGAPAWGMVATVVEGGGLVLPDDLADAALWPAPGAWSATVRVQGGPDGRAAHVFILPPVPETGVASRLSALMKRVRFEAGSREGVVKVSRIEVPADGAGEGARP
ncbi:MAG: hypothetical protein R6X19_01075 [Kiritimatiellia bacterium]